MKKTVIIASLLATILFSACDQRDTIDVYETSSTDKRDLVQEHWHREHHRLDHDKVQREGFFSL